MAGSGQNIPIGWPDPSGSLAIAGRTRPTPGTGVGRTPTAACSDFVHNDCAMNPIGVTSAPRSVTLHKQPGKMYRVFVVEDSPSIREALVGNLESTGLIEVIGSADSADAAWKDERLATADAIIVDLALRTSSGFELLSRLKSSPNFANVPRIVLTNYAIAIFRERALSLGADYFFDKSLQFDQAVELLEKLARGHAARNVPNV